MYTVSPFTTPEIVLAVAIMVIFCVLVIRASKPDKTAC